VAGGGVFRLRGCICLGEGNKPGGEHLDKFTSALHARLV
jgi:hypothetical protein